MQAGDQLEVGAHRVTVRAVAAEDAAFLRTVYAHIREPELAQVPWSAEDKRRFIEHQFAAQDHAYRTNYPGADLLILVVDGIPAGRLYVHRRATEIRIMDIALLPPFRGQGIGTSVLRSLQEEATRSERAVTIHVEIFNPAMRLYERLGFTRVSQNDVYVLMEWRRGSAASS